MSNVDYSRRLHKLIYDADISMADFGRLIGISPFTVSSWCQGKSTPSDVDLDKIANGFNISTSELRAKLGI